MSCHPTILLPFLMVDQSNDKQHNILTRKTSTLSLFIETWKTDKNHSQTVSYTKLLQVTIKLLILSMLFSYLQTCCLKYSHRPRMISLFFYRTVIASQKYLKLYFYCLKLPILYNVHFKSFNDMTGLCHNLEFRTKTWQSLTKAFMIEFHHLTNKTWEFITISISNILLCHLINNNNNNTHVTIPK